MGTILDNTDNWAQLGGAVPCNENGKINGVLVTYHDDGVPMVSILAASAEQAELLKPRALDVYLRMWR